jgi:hypothetical protein
MLFQNILLTLAATILCAVNSSPVPVNPSEAATYWDAKVNEASVVNSGRRNDWHELIVAVNEARTGGHHLDDEIVNAVVKFNTPEYKNCEVVMKRADTGGPVYLKFGVQCGRVEALRGISILNSGRAKLELLASPDGYGSGTDILKLFEAMARFKAAKTITIGEDMSVLFLFRDKGKEENKEIRSTVLMTLLSGKFKSYYHTLGYRYLNDYETDDVQNAANELLAMTVGEWIKTSTAASLDTQQLRDSDTYDPKMKFYELFQELHKKASGSDGVPVDQGAKDLLLMIVSGMGAVWEKGEHTWAGVPGYSALAVGREFTKSF